MATTELKLLSIHDVVRDVSLSRAQVYKLLAEGAFPQPVAVGRSSRWRSDEIEAWIEGLPRKGGAAG